MRIKALQQPSAWSGLLRGTPSEWAIAHRSAWGRLAVCRVNLPRGWRSQLSAQSVGQRDPVLKRTLLVATVAICCGASPAALRQPSAAMEPSLLVGDEFVVAPFTAPQRGQIVVLAIVRDSDRSVAPASAHPEQERSFDIKRIVALPGDTLSIEKGLVTLNSDVITKSDPVRSYADINGQQSSVYVEEIGERQYEVLEADEIDRGQSVLSVPPEHVYVLGDNRDHSRDSRVFGPFPIKDVVGVVGEIRRSVHPGTEASRPERVGTTPR
jgi:signal peptidase I